MLAHLRRGDLLFFHSNSTLHVVGDNRGEEYNNEIELKKFGTDEIMKIHCDTLYSYQVEQVQMEIKKAALLDVLDHGRALVLTDDNPNPFEVLVRDDQYDKIKALLDSGDVDCRLAEICGCLVLLDAFESRKFSQLTGQ